MRVAVVGGGDSGRQIAQAVRDRGGEAVMLSRSTGFDVQRAGAARTLHDTWALGRDAGDETAPFDVFVEATGTAAASAKRATAFFTRSTRTVAEAAGLFGARHVLLSIVGCSRPEVQGFAYYAGKTAQERAARDVSGGLTIVRTTQWFEFGRQMLRRMRFGPVVLVPAMRIQPVALSAVADVIAGVAVGTATAPPAGASADAGVVELAGPEVMMLRDLVRRLRGAPKLVASLSIPTAWGRAFRGDALLPDASARSVGPTLTEWLAAPR